MLFIRMQVKIMYTYLLILIGCYLFVLLWEEIISVAFFKKKYKKLNNIILLRNFSLARSSSCANDIPINYNTV